MPSGGVIPSKEPSVFVSTRAVPEVEVAPVIGSTEMTGPLTVAPWPIPPFTVMSTACTILPFPSMRRTGSGLASSEILPSRVTFRWALKFPVWFVPPVSKVAGLWLVTLA